MECPKAINVQQCSNLEYSFFNFSEETFLNLHVFDKEIVAYLVLGSTWQINWYFICQGTSTKRKQSDLFAFQVKQLPVITSLWV